MTRESTTEDRRSFDGNASKIVRMCLVGAERSIAVSVSQAKEWSPVPTPYCTHSNATRKWNNRVNTCIYTPNNPAFTASAEALLQWNSIAENRRLTPTVLLRQIEEHRPSWERRFGDERWRRQLSEGAQYPRSWPRIPVHRKTLRRSPCWRSHASTAEEYPRREDVCGFPAPR